MTQESKKSAHLRFGMETTLKLVVMISEIIPSQYGHTSMWATQRHVSHMHGIESSSPSLVTKYEVEIRLDWYTCPQSIKLYARLRSPIRKRF